MEELHLSSQEQRSVGLGLFAPAWKEFAGTHKGERESNKKPKTPHKKGQATGAENQVSFSV